MFCCFKKKKQIKIPKEVIYKYNDVDKNDPYKIYNHSTYKIENFYEDKKKI
jgi:hypothetical protein